MIVAACSGAVEQPAAAVDAAAGAPSPVASEPRTPPWCALRGRRDAIGRLLRDLWGDFTVLKYSAQFAEHAEIATLARDAGAERTAPVVVVGVRAMNRRAISRIVVAGTGEPRRFASRVVAGSVDDLDGAVAVTQASADMLGLAVGDRIAVAADPPVVSDLTDPTFVTLRVAAVLAVPGEDTWPTLGTRFSITAIDTARRLASLGPDDSTAVAVWASAPADVGALSKRLAERAGSLYRVIGQDELNGTSFAWLDHLGGLCPEGAPAAAPPPSRPPRGDVCTLDVAREEELLRSLWGDVAVWDSAGLDEAAARRELESHGATEPSPAVTSEVTLLSDTAMLDVTLVGKPAATLGAVPLRVEAGSLTELAQDGAVALARNGAEHLGVRLGDELWMVSPVRQAEPPAWAQTRVRLVAVLAPSVTASNANALVLARLDRARPMIGVAEGTVDFVGARDRDARTTDELLELELSVGRRLPHASVRELEEMAREDLRDLHVLRAACAFTPAHTAAEIPP
jgi:ABC-type lipoprotein release transport system permease subunit